MLETQSRRDAFRIAAAFGGALANIASGADVDTSGVEEEIRAIEQRTRELQARTAANQARLDAAKKLGEAFKENAAGVLEARTNVEAELSRKATPAEILRKYNQLYPKYAKN